MLRNNGLTDFPSYTIDDEMDGEGDSGVTSNFEAVAEAVALSRRYRKKVQGHARNEFGMPKKKARMPPTKSKVALEGEQYAA